MLPHLPLDSHDMPVLNLFLYSLNCLSVSGLCVGVWCGSGVQHFATIFCRRQLLAVRDGGMSVLSSTRLKGGNGRAFVFCLIVGAFSYVGGSWLWCAL